MITDELMEEHLTDETVEKTQEEKEADAFMKKLSEAKEIIQAEGGFAGLCEHCLDTKQVYITRSDGYEGLQYKIDNEVAKIVKCFCGESPEEDFPF